MELLRTLCDAQGLPGYEDEVREIIMKVAGPYADSVHVDSAGNLFMTKGERKQGPHLMFAAHMDEVGLMVERIDDEGFIKALALGGVDPRVLPAKRVRVGKEGIPGIIGIKPPHLEKPDEMKRVTPISELRIDVGASSREEVERFAEPGSPICFDTRFEKQEEILKAKAFDDRVGCYVIAELIKQEFDYPVTFVWTVQEEMGLRGARMATARVRPDFLIVVEGTGAGDAPTDLDVARNPFLGKGPVITILDGSVVCDERLVSLITKVGDANRIPWQYKRPLVGGTDAGGAVRVRALGAAVIAVPARYIHSPVALAHEQDIITTIELVKAVGGRLREVVF